MRRLKFSSYSKHFVILGEIIKTEHWKARYRKLQLHIVSSINLYPNGLNLTLYLKPRGKTQKKLTYKISGFQDVLKPIKVIIKLGHGREQNKAWNKKQRSLTSFLCILTFYMWINYRKWRYINALPWLIVWNIWKNNHWICFSAIDLCV
jgi:hypothetical protein